MQCCRSFHEHSQKIFKILCTTFGIWGTKSLICHDLGGLAPPSPYVEPQCPGVFNLEGFVRGGFCPFHLLSEYICYNRKLKITLNFMFPMYDKKIKSVTSHALDLCPVTNCHTFSDPLPLERDLLYGRPQNYKIYTRQLCNTRRLSFAFMII